MRLKNVMYPPEPCCNDALVPEDLPDALEAWEHECNRITIEQLQNENERMKDFVVESRIYNYCSAKLYSARVVKDRIRLRKELEVELEQALIRYNKCLKKYSKVGEQF